MAHNLENNKERGTVSFYSLKENAWHNLGNVVQEAKTPDEVLRIANLDYEVALAPLYASFIPEGCYTNIVDSNKIAVFKKDTKEIVTKNDEVLIIPKKGELINSHYATFRTDNFDILGVVGSRYEPVQNDVSVDFIFDVCKNNNILKKEDIIIETAGVLGKGERIFVTAKLPKTHIGKDEVEQYILFTTSHDGSGSICAGFTNIRVVCNNTLNASLRNIKNKMTFKHTKNVAATMKETANIVNTSMRYTESLKQCLEYSQSIKVTDSIITDFILDLLLDVKQISYLKDKGGITKLVAGDSVISTVKQNQFYAFRDYMEKGVGQDTNRGTAYWMYNGITSYLNNGMRYKNSLDKFDSLNDGNSFKINQKAFNLLTDKVLTEQY